MSRLLTLHSLSQKGETEVRKSLLERLEGIQDFRTLDELLVGEELFDVMVSTQFEEIISFGSRIVVEKVILVQRNKEGEVFAITDETDEFRRVCTEDSVVKRREIGQRLMPYDNIGRPSAAKTGGRALFVKYTNDKTQFNL